MFLKNAVRSELEDAGGIVLSLPRKQEVMVYLKRLMQDRWSYFPFDRKLTAS